jgi:putative Holliday junction resolvase
MPRILGIDLGTRRIGVAISDTAGKVATPFLTLPRTSDDADSAALADLARGEGCKQVVLGYPIALDGTKGDAAAVTEAFAEKLKANGVRVKLYDERLTTKEAEKKLRTAGKKAKQQRLVIDKVAASILLQSFLDSKK